MGNTWGAETRLTNDGGSSTRPSVTAYGSNVHVVWEDTRNGGSEIYYKRSSDAGLTWSSDIRLTNDPGGSYTNYNYAWCIGANGNQVHVVWRDSRTNGTQVYYKRSTDGGLNWGADMQLSNGSPAWGPSVFVSGLNVHVVWPDYRDGNEKDYYKRSTDGGLTWGIDTRLTNNSASSEHSSVSVSGTTVHVVWEDTRDGNWEIYYKRDPTGNPVGITNINSEVPLEFALFQNYPNPFNPATIINFQLPIFNYVRLTIFDILGREIATPVNEELKPGVYQVEFDGRNFPSGAYYYRLTSGDFVQTRLMVLVK